MEFTVYNIVAASVFFILYAVVALLAGSKLYQEFCSEKVIPIEGDTDIVSYENLRLIQVYKGEITTFFALVWPILAMFFLSVDLGKSIYNNFIYSGNEEDRIASWLF